MKKQAVDTTACSFIYILSLYIALECYTPAML